MLNKKWLISLVVMGSVVTGCSTNDIQTRGKLDYMNANSSNPLELPPDLTKQTASSNHAINVLSQYRKQTSAGRQSNVLAGYDSVHMESAGDQRWIVAKLPADFIWSRALQLFQELGLKVESSDPQAGIAETAWAENRADVPDSFIRNMLSKAMGNMFSSPTRDKFKLRLERRGDDTILVHVTHYGMRDKATGNDEQFHTWVDRPRDPELEAELLSRLMVKLGGSAEQSQRAAAAAGGGVDSQGLITSVQEGNRLVINRPFESVWMQVGNILDDGSQYRVEVQDSQNYNYTVLRSKKAKRGLKFWKSGIAHDSFKVSVIRHDDRTTVVDVRPLADGTYQQALIDHIKTNLH